jgi:hypothetical protein
VIGTAAREGHPSHLAIPKTDEMGIRLVAE